MWKKYLTDRLAAAYRLPERNFAGWFALKLMHHQNYHMEKAAVRLSRIAEHHQVLELGFGPGIGLSAAYKNIKDGRGKIYGVDHSPYVIKHANKSFRKQINEGKMEIHRSDVVCLPFPDDTFDRVFHCNCYYFWNDLASVAREIHRVMKPESLMVMTLSLADIEERENWGLLPRTRTNVLDYMLALENAEFVNVYIAYLKYKGFPYQAVFAEVDKS